MLELTDMDIGKADPTQEESRIITATAFRETVDAVLPEQKGLHYNRLSTAAAVDDDVSCTQFMFCLIRVIRQTGGNVTNLELVEKVDWELDSIEKIRKKARGPGTKEQKSKPFKFCFSRSLT
ncbi:hypothetical protein QL285_064854 [Trifolium repens]|nr:hypothetical protein QL285_064851 [Trifolium repens]KAK2391390.1 hypothetical protein QL285_064854 [Trifolium repens]